ncbi:TcfC E-set like domain-containing protein [Sphingomonas sp. 22R3R2A-7]|uniref:TcfC E-set like domain-containing protein n=1 Tax=Sphingomonas sp. 22R3R2A-7 TaxID=3050230 RepID=UPI002FE2A714
MYGSGFRLDRLAVPLLLAGTIAPIVAHAQDSTGKTGVVVGQPAGFDQLASVQQAVVDVQIGGRIVGQAQIIHGAGRLTFVDVDAVIALIPDLRDPAAIRAVLGAPELDAHAELVCAADAVPAACATLQPAVAGVVFDEARFRVDIVVNPLALSVHAAAERHYLRPPSDGLSLVDQFGGTIAGSGGTAEIALNNRAIFGYRNARLRNELFYSSRFGLVVDTLAAELDKPGVRYAAGALWAPGIDLTGRRKIVGAGVQSQQDTRLDRMLIAGSPLVVSLAVRSRVDILREGRLVSSRTYDAGNHALDSASLPDGAYEVILQNPGSGRRCSRRAAFLYQGRRDRGGRRADLLRLCGAARERPPGDAGRGVADAVLRGGRGAPSVPACRGRCHAAGDRPDRDARAGRLLAGRTRADPGCGACLGPRRCGSIRPDFLAGIREIELHPRRAPRVEPGRPAADSAR